MTGSPGPGGGAGPPPATATATPRPLGPGGAGALQDALTSYCRSTAPGVAPGRVVAVATDDGWACRVTAPAAGTVDMDAACRWAYGPDAWAGMTDGDDVYTWRCYRY